MTASNRGAKRQECNGEKGAENVPDRLEIMMNDTDLYAVLNMASSSPAMFERRRRVLNEARKLIGKGHPDGFSIRELCDRAGVAPNTIYNAFGNKDNVVALAILQYYKDFHSNVPFRENHGTFRGVVEREMATVIGNLDIPHYVRALAGLFFSPTSSQNLRSTLITIGGQMYLPWLAELRVSRQVEKGVDFDRVATNISAMVYAQVQQWRVDSTDSETYVVDRLDAVMSYLAGITKGDARRAVRSVLADLHGPRDMLKKLIAEARAALDEAARKKAKSVPA